jgi:hypothetical protein
MKPTLVFLIAVALGILVPALVNAQSPRLPRASRLSTIRRPSFSGRFPRFIRSSVRCFSRPLPWPMLPCLMPRLTSAAGWHNSLRATWLRSAKCLRQPWVSVGTDQPWRGCKRSRRPAAQEDQNQASHKASSVACSASNATNIKGHLWTLRNCTPSLTTSPVPFQPSTSKDIHGLYTTPISI